MKELSYWLDIPYTARRSLSGSISADVVIIGGGISGVSTAYHCAKQGFKTVLVEKEAIASGSAGKNGGMVVEGFSMDLLEAIDQFGLEAARDAWARTVEARKAVQSLVKEHDIDCDLEQSGSLYVASTEPEGDWLRKEATTRINTGIPCRLIESSDQIHASPFCLALYNQTDCLIHPVKFVRGVAKAAEQLGASIYEHSPALSYTPNIVTTQNGVIKASKVVLAIESAMENLVPEQGKIIREQAIVTQPLTDEQIKSLDWQIGGMLWTAGKDYINIRKIGARLFASYKISSNPTKNEQDTQTQTQIELITKCFPTLSRKSIQISHRWTGLLLITNRSRPYIGQRGGLYEVFGHGGNGLTNGIMAGKMLAESFKGFNIPTLYQFES